MNVCYEIICDRCWMCCESLWLWLCANVIYMVIGVICDHVGCVLNCGWICMCDNIWHNDVMCDVEMCEIVLNDVELMWICVYMYVCLVWPLSWEVYDDLLNCVGWLNYSRWNVVLPIGDSKLNCFGIKCKNDFCVELWLTFGCFEKICWFCNIVILIGIEMF